MMKNLDRCKKGIQIAMDDDSLLGHKSLHLATVFEIHPSLFIAQEIASRLTVVSATPPRRTVRTASTISNPTRRCASMVAAPM